VNSAPHNISALTDISANIFALLIFILIIMLAAQARAPLARPEAGVDIETDISGIERVPLSSDDLFDLLYDRGEGAAAVKIDLFNRGIDVSFNGKSESFRSVESAVPRLRQIAASAGVPVGLYVFSHHFYRDLTRNLQSFGRPWREVSVPQALRDFRAARRGQGWSAGFSELISRPSNRAQFRAELARLLQSSSADKSASQSSPGGGGVSEWPEAIIDSVARWLRAALNAISVLGGLVFVSWVELRRNR
jgi:hypothetical protein